MGCDIHIYAEYFKDGKWQPADPWVRDDKYEEGQESWRIPFHQGVHRDRDYDWFGFLADVRNGTWGEPMPVLAEPRGLPADCCEQIRECSEEWGQDGHSHSWFTLEELEEGFAAHKDQVIWFEGAVGGLRDNTPELEAWKAQPEETRGSPPGGYSASGWGPNGEHQKYRWCKTVGDELRQSYAAVTKYLQQAYIEYGCSPETVRIVFWFDN